MNEPEIGFEIQGKVYPWIGFDDWKHKEIKAVRAVTGYNPRELLIGEASAAEINLGFATVAFWRGHPEVDERELVIFMGELKPADIDPKGFGTLKDDARPPDQSPGNEPSENTEPSSESTPEKSNLDPSGEPSSPSTDSGSGPQKASRS